MRNEPNIIDPFGRFLKLAEVERSVGIKRTKIYEHMRNPDLPFPKPLKIDNSAVWIEGEVVLWKAEWIRRQRRQPDPIGYFRVKLGLQASELDPERTP